MTHIVCLHLEDHWRKEKDPDLLVRGTHPRIRIRNTAFCKSIRYTGDHALWPGVLDQCAWLSRRTRPAGLVWWCSASPGASPSSPLSPPSSLQPLPIGNINNEMWVQAFPVPTLEKFRFRIQAILVFLMLEAALILRMLSTHFLLLYSGSTKERSLSPAVPVLQH